jgi:hypothetical protein
MAPRFNGVATKNLPNDLGWRRALEAGSTKPTRQNGSSEPSEIRHANR